MGVLGPGGWEREWRDFERDKEGMKVRRGLEERRRMEGADKVSVVSRKGKRRR